MKHLIIERSTWICFQIVFYTKSPHSYLVEKLGISHPGIRARFLFLYSKYCNLNSPLTHEIRNTGRQIDRLIEPPNSFQSSSRIYNWFNEFRLLWKVRLNWHSIMYRYREERINKKKIYVSVSVFIYDGGMVLWFYARFMSVLEREGSSSFD